MHIYIYVITCIYTHICVYTHFQIYVSIYVQMWLPCGPPSPGKKTRTTSRMADGKEHRAQGGGLEIVRLLAEKPLNLEVQGACTCLHYNPLIRPLSRVSQAIISF